MWEEGHREVPPYPDYALKQMPLRQHAFVQDADNFNNTLGG